MKKLELASRKEESGSSSVNIHLSDAGALTIRSHDLDYTIIMQMFGSDEYEDVVTVPA
jgi:hypothetical protein